MAGYRKKKLNLETEAVLQEHPEFKDNPEAEFAYWQEERKKKEERRKAYDLQKQKEERKKEWMHEKKSRIRSEMGNN